MTLPHPEKPRRRPRYRGKNPRHFHEKYKEHQPGLYPDEIARVLAGGRTPAGSHVPIMVREILEILAPRPGEIAVDCTLGHGGHARELLAAIQPGGRLVGIDADPIELERTERRLRSLGFADESLIVRHTNFAGIRRVLAELAPEGVDLVLADLGLSSMQIDDPSRGFTFKVDGPLDMRMNITRGRTAQDLLSTLNEARLARLLAENADEPHAAELAGAILNAHAREPIARTGALASIVRKTVMGQIGVSPDSAKDTVRRVFQALRIAVNDELGALSALLRSLSACLKPGGRVAILSFHSGEDRLVKAAFKAGLEDGTYRSIATDVIRAGADERRDNPRSRSAKLRFAVCQS
jgi:16S rRNA (cytosine1402-N4)-methyltransferase